MRYEVYLDAVILIQFVMNYCVLRLTESLMRLKTSRLRVVLASLAGAFGSCLLFLPIGLNAYLKFIFVFILFGSLMLGIAFRVRGMRQYLCMLLAIVSTTFLLGGVVQWLMSMLGRNIPMLLWIVLVWVIYCLLQFGLKQYRKQKSLFIPVTILLEGDDKSTKQISIIALKDTGNRLREESTGKAVCIIEQGIADFKKEELYKVTYHTLGNENDEMNAQMIPRMVIHTKEGDVVSKDVMLALYPGKISKKGAYHMILHPEYLKED